jgi:hypothetical protein
LPQFWTTLRLYQRALASFDITCLDNREWHSACQQLVRDFVSPAVADCDRQELLYSFHFLFEPHLLFRLKCKDEGSRKRVKDTVRTYFPNIAALVREEQIAFDDNYHGEAPDYGGEENWLIVEKFLEAGSRFFMRRVTNHHGTRFTVWTLAHLFLNCNNYLPPLEECRSLVALFCERMQYYDAEANTPLKGSLDRETSRRYFYDFFDRLWNERASQRLLQELP